MASRRARRKRILADDCTIVRDLIMLNGYAGSGPGRNADQDQPNSRAGLIPGEGPSAYVYGDP